MAVCLLDGSPGREKLEEPVQGSESKKESRGESSQLRHLLYHDVCVFCPGSFSLTGMRPAQLSLRLIICLLKAGNVSPLIRKSLLDGNA